MEGFNKLHVPRWKNKIIISIYFFESLVWQSGKMVGHYVCFLFFFALNFQQFIHFYAALCKGRYFRSMLLQFDTNDHVLFARCKVIMFTRRCIANVTVK